MGFRFERFAGNCGIPREEKHEETEQGGGAFCIGCACHAHGRVCPSQEQRQLARC
jgi:hypothetical protein